MPKPWLFNRVNLWIFTLFKLLVDWDFLVFGRFEISKTARFVRFGDITRFGRLEDIDDRSFLTGLERYGRPLPLLSWLNLLSSTWGVHWEKRQQLVPLARSALIGPLERVRNLRSAVWWMSGDSFWNKNTTTTNWREDVIISKLLLPSGRCSLYCHFIFLELKPSLPKPTWTYTKSTTKWTFIWNTMLKWDPGEKVR